MIARADGGAGRSQSAYVRSVAGSAAIGELLRRRYGMEVAGCVLVRSLTNDVYAVSAADRRFILKLYGAGGWTAAEVAWEQELVGHLVRAGLPVPPPVPLSDGSLAGEVEAPEGSRPFALTAYIEGEKPQAPHDHVLYRELGELIARFHLAADDFSGSHDRRSPDLVRALDEPLEQVIPLLADRPRDQELVRVLGAEARRQVEEMAARGLEWGVRHGDVTLDNVQRTPEGLVLHDFDQAAPGWRAADLTGVHATGQWDAFLAGYQGVRGELARVEVAALPWLGVVGRIANLRYHLVDKPTFRGAESIAEGWVDRELASLQAAARLLR